MTNQNVQQMYVRPYSIATKKSSFSSHPIFHISLIEKKCAKITNLETESKCNCIIIFNKDCLSARTVLHFKQAVSPSRKTTTHFCLPINQWLHINNIKTVRPPNSPLPFLTHTHICTHIKGYDPFCCGQHYNNISYTKLGSIYNLNNNRLKQCNLYPG